MAYGWAGHGGQVAVDGGADSQKGEGGVGRGGGRGVYTTRAFFRGSPFKFEGWARFWHRIFDKNVPGGVHAKCGKKLGFLSVYTTRVFFLPVPGGVYENPAKYENSVYTTRGIFRAKSWPRAVFGRNFSRPASEKSPWWCIRFLLPAALSPGWNHGWADRHRVGGKAYGSVLKREATHCA